MVSYIALVRAVNVGGTGKLPMATLRSLCLEAGFQAVRTYINSGNVVFTSDLREPDVRSVLTARLAAYAGKPVPVAVRTADDMAAVLAANPFQDGLPSRTVAIFLNERPPRDMVAQAAGRSNERLALGLREIYVDYGERMADSRLRFPGLEAGTARNMNTIARLAAMAQEQPT